MSYLSYFTARVTHVKEPFTNFKLVATSGREACSLIEAHCAKVFGSTPLGVSIDKVSVDAWGKFFGHVVDNPRYQRSVSSSFKTPTQYAVALSSDSTKDLYDYSLYEASSPNHALNYAFDGIGSVQAPVDSSEQKVWFYRVFPVSEGDLLTEKVQPDEGIEENVEAPHHSFLTVLGLVRDAKESSIALNDVLCKLRDRNLFPTGYEKVKFCDKGHMLTYRYKIKGEDAIIEAMEIIDLAGTAQIYYEERRKSLVVFVEFLNY